MDPIQSNAGRGLVFRLKAMATVAGNRAHAAVNPVVASQTTDNDGIRIEAFGLRPANGRAGLMVVALCLFDFTHGPMTRG